MQFGLIRPATVCGWLASIFRFLASNTGKRGSVTLRPFLRRPLLERPAGPGSPAIGWSLFRKYSGSEVLIDGTEYLMLRKDEILAGLE